MIYFTGNLHPDATENTLDDEFSVFGLVESIRVCREIDTKKPLGYAYVSFRQRNDGTSIPTKRRFLSTFS